ncbi:MAG: hypothetical protein NW215_10725 [Hyphomicrobiales bacterium]|nr:hypothetical protein [Hyphomicrobiales bacterium]
MLKTALVSLLALNLAIAPLGAQEPPKAETPKVCKAAEADMLALAAAIATLLGVIAWLSRDGKSKSEEPAKVECGK